MLKESVWRLRSRSIFPICFIASSSFINVLWKVSDCTKKTACKKNYYKFVAKITIFIGFSSGAVGLFQPFRCLPPLLRLLQLPQILGRLTKLACFHIITINFSLSKYMSSMWYSLSTLKVLSKQNSFLDFHQIPVFSPPAARASNFKCAMCNIWHVQLWIFQRFSETALLVYLSSHSLIISASPQPVSGGLMSAPKEKTGENQCHVIFWCIFVTSNHHSISTSNHNYSSQDTTLISTGAEWWWWWTWWCWCWWWWWSPGGGGASVAFFVDQPSACVRKSPSLVWAEGIPH